MLHKLTLASAMCVFGAPVKPAHQPQTIAEAAQGGPILLCGGEVQASGADTLIRKGKSGFVVEFAKSPDDEDGYASEDQSGSVCSDDERVSLLL